MPWHSLFCAQMPSILFNCFSHSVCAVTDLNFLDGRWWWRCYSNKTQHKLFTTIARNHPTPTIHQRLQLLLDKNCRCWVLILVKCTPWPQEEELVSSENSASIFNTLSDLPSQLRDGPAVLGEAMRLAGTLSQETLEAHRHKHLAYILNEQTQLNNGNNTTLNTNLNKVSGGSLV